MSLQLKIVIGFFLIIVQLKAQTNCAFFSTYFGGTQSDEIKGVCVDNNNNSYIIGNTYSTDLPVTSGLITDTASGNYDVFLAKFDSCGELIWCTYFGSTNFDSGEKIEIAHDGNIVFCGYTNGLDLPATTGSFQLNNAGSFDCFVTKITPTGTIIWSTYFGKENGDFAYDITVDALDNIVIGGTSTSTNLYTTPVSFQENHNGNTDAFIARFTKDGTLKWCTYYGGTSSEDIHAITTDNNCNIIGVGGSFSSNLSTSIGAYQMINEGGADVYILKLDSNCTRVFSSYIGGSGVEDAWGVVTDSDNNIYMSGHTNSFDFDTTAFAYQTIKQGSLSDWYLTKWTPFGDLVYSTLFGGSNNDLLANMVFLVSNKLMLIGKTESQNIPILGVNNQSTLSGNYDAFLALFDVESMNPVWSSYYGGTLYEDPLDISSYSDTNIVFVGNTNSENYPTSANPYQSSLNMSSDGVITKLIFPNISTTNIKNNFLIHPYKLFPNPFKDIIAIDCEIDFLVEIKNIYGESVYINNNKKEIDLSNLILGVYFITLTSNGFSATQKLVKQ